MEFDEKKKKGEIMAKKILISLQGGKEKVPEA